MDNTNRPYRIVVVDHTFPGLDVEEKVVKKSGLRAEVRDPQCDPNNPDDIIGAVADADGILIQNAVINKSIIDTMTHCKVIALYGVGIESVDIAAATKSGIAVANVPDYCINEVADHAMALMLSCVRKVTEETVAVKARQPGMVFGGPLFPPIFKLRELTLGLVGFGNVARNIVSKATPFGLSIIAHDPFVSDAILQEYHVERVSLEALLEQSDIVSLHLPKTPNTIALIDKAVFQRMKPTAFLINTSRGALVDEAALYCALKERWIAGAGIDVTVDEPILPDNPLLGLSNLLITNHIGYYSEGCLDELRTKTMQEVVRVLRGDTPRSVAFVNPDIMRKECSD